MSGFFQVLFFVVAVLHEGRRSLQHGQNVDLRVFLQLSASLEEFEDVLLYQLLLVVTDLLVTGWSKDLLHFYDLNSLGISRKHRRPHDQLEKNAAYCPDIDRCGVLIASENELRCPVIPTHNIGSIHTSASRI